ncbi:ABC transporter substrate-binding protein [Nocardioides sp. R-C-SC26]|uniref:ABC transporter substrate-binding protein n=1 Tax=Nocardioides sp. R-C-SC26 TaxID=2870414 RepID=UPI001E2C2CC7|nr:ABC transporter substrate-binding protein [Nocardioides sp. R-C-SC26]
MSPLTPRRLAPAGAVLLAATLLAACSGDDSSTDSSRSSGGPGTDARPAATGPVSVTDATGTEIALDEPATSVVCLDVTCLDTLRLLDLAPTASSQFAVVEDPNFFADEASAITSIGGTFFEPDLEGILAVQPDLVIGAASVHAEMRAALGDVPMYLATISDETDAIENVETVATLVGRTEQAAEAIAGYRDVVAAYGPQARDTTVLSMYGGATDDIGIDAADSSIGATLADFTSYPWPTASEADGGFLEINLEQILDVDPDWIWVLDFGFDPDAPALVEQLADEPVWESLTAVQQGHVEVTPSWWGGTGGLLTRQLVLDTVLPTVYPEEFSAPLGPLVS